MTTSPRIHTPDTGVELPDPRFEVLGVTPRLHSAAPVLEFDVHVSEQSGRQVYAIALTAQVMIEPARRAYDAETQARLEELFGPPERWGATTRSLLWHQAQTLVGEFTGATTFRLEVPCSYDMELVAAKYFHSLPGGEVPLGFNFNGTIHYRGDDGRLQMSLVPWSATTDYRMDVGAWRTLMEHHYPNRAWLGVSDATLAALQRERARRALSTLDEVVAALLEERGMTVEALVDSLLFEGYALYPYTPGATKNATPTPFGIVYPPAYADARSTFAELVVDCMAEAEPGTRLEAEVRFLQPDGTRHEASPRTLALPAASVGGEPVSVDAVFPTQAGPPLELRATLTAREDGARIRVTLRVENRGEAPSGMDRGAALARSALSTHPLLRLSAGRFLSPLEVGAGCHSVNTWPVLASPQDDVMLGAAIVLPDHPTLAPESLGGLFDSTEIEEALMIHVQALSDGERAEIAAGDPAVAAMIERAAHAAPEDVLRLHGRVELRDPQPEEHGNRESLRPPSPSPAVRDPTRGEAQVTVDGRTFRRGDSVVLRPGPEADLQARMLEGRSATIERIYVDLDGKVHLGVTPEGLPGQEILRETSRFLFFFPPEVEVTA